MVKLKGPMLSQSASGALGPAVTFSHCKGRAYARKRGVPADPKTPDQVSYRAIVAFLSAAWKTFSDADQATWTLRAIKDNIPPYSAFVAHNIDRWTQFKRPGQVDPVLEDGDTGNTRNNAADGGVGFAIVHPELRDAGDIWGCTIHRSTLPAFTATRTNCIALIPTPSEIEYSYQDRNLAPGTYYYQARFFTTHGKIGTVETERSATVT